MSILVACEESQIVTKALRDKGHEAYSCDILPTSGANPEWHIQHDVIDILSQSWDAIIAFPPCTHLAASGARYFEEKQKDGRQQAAIDFFLAIWNSGCPQVAIENPVGIMSRWRKPDQIIQPYQFGHDASKKTCLWLRGLPKLQPTLEVPGRKHNGRTLWANQTPSGQNKLGPSKDRAKIRSKTYPGIAKAMADQWFADAHVVCEKCGHKFPGHLGVFGCPNCFYEKESHV